MALVTEEQMAALRAHAEEGRERLLGAAPCSPSPDCCAEWTRSVGLIDSAWRAAKYFGFHYSWPTFTHCPWCGRAKENEDFRDPAK